MIAATLMEWHPIQSLATEARRSSGEGGGATKRERRLYLYIWLSKHTFSSALRCFYCITKGEFVQSPLNVHGLPFLLSSGFTSKLQIVGSLTKS